MGRNLDALAGPSRETSVGQEAKKSAEAERSSYQSLEI